MELNEICELIVDCEHKTAPTQDSGYPSIRTPNIGRGRFILEGVKTTIPFLARVIRHPDFVAGTIDTKFLEREPQLLRPEISIGESPEP